MSITLTEAVDVMCRKVTAALIIDSEGNLMFKESGHQPKFVNFPSISQELLALIHKRCNTALYQ